MTTTRLWIYGAIVGILVLGLATTCGYEHGKTVGHSVVLVQHDDSVNKADAIRAAKDSLKVKALTDSTKVLLMIHASDSVKLERAQAKRDTSKSLAHGERGLFTLKGDTAIVNGLSYVLPKTVATYVRFTDTLEAKQADLDAIRAQSDSNSSRTIARLETLSASKDSLITDLHVTITDQQGEIKDLKAEKSPRFGFKSGLALGAAVIATLVHFIK